MNALTRGLAACILVLACAAAQAAASWGPETVKFPSADGKTQLTGYVFAPGDEGPYPAIVLLHGRAGAYSSLRRGTYDATSLSARHRMWGRWWASRGYVAVLVDSFGPRGYPNGFPKHSYSQRPAEVSEQTVRPLDAYGAAAYLRSRRDVMPERIGVQGWSNGGMTVLATLRQDAPGLTPDNPFRAGIAQYPGCRTQVKDAAYMPYAPLMMFAAMDDDEVSPEVCRELAERLKAKGAPLEFVPYEGAHHAYDAPGRTKQSHAPNQAALHDTLRRAAAFFDLHLKSTGE